VPGVLVVATMSWLMVGRHFVPRVSVNSAELWMLRVPDFDRLLSHGRVIVVVGISSVMVLILTATSGRVIPLLVHIAITFLELQPEANYW
jgi:hypothetical protein